MKKLIPLLLLSLTWTSLAQPPDSPVRVVMNGFVADNVIAGSVTAVATKSDILSLETTGFANLDKKTKIFCQNYKLLHQQLLLLEHEFLFLLLHLK